MPVFEASQTVNASPEEVFDFSIHPHKVLAISDPDAGLSFISTPEKLAHGSQLEIQMAGFGPPQTLVHEITEFSAPDRFVEEQVRGPLKKFVHTHLFEQSPDGGTLVIDRIDFEAPGGMIGFLVTADRIHKSLQEGFAYRHQKLKEHFA